MIPSYVFDYMIIFSLMRVLESGTLELVNV